MSDLTFVLDSSTIPGAQSHDFEIQFPASIDLRDMQHEAALVSLNLWNTWYNVAASWDNNRFRYYNGSVWKTITIPDGNYNLDALVEAINDGITIDGDNKIEFKANYSTQKLYIELPSGYEIDFTVGKMYKLLGFAPAILSVSQYGTSKVNITNDVNELQLHCSMINAGMYVNNRASDVMYSFVPAAPPGASLNFRVDTPIYMATQSSRYIGNVRLYLTDQKNRPVSLNGEHLTATIHLRPRKLLSR